MSLKSSTVMPLSLSSGCTTSTSSGSSSCLLLFRSQDFCKRIRFERNYNWGTRPQAWRLTSGMKSRNWQPWICSWIALILKIPKPNLFACVSKQLQRQSIVESWQKICRKFQNLNVNFFVFALFLYFLWLRKFGIHISSCLGLFSLIQSLIWAFQSTHEYTISVGLWFGPWLNILGLFVWYIHLQLQLFLQSFNSF